jgi:hypothetical protein
MKLLLKLAIAGLVANAAWRVGTSYASYYGFKDSVRQAALVREQSEAMLRDRVVKIGADYGVPVTEDSFTITTELRRVFLAGSYVQPILLLPGYEYPWPFVWEVEAYLVEPPRLQ